MIHLADFEEKRLDGAAAAVPYYSAQTKNGFEMCLEPLTFGRWYVAMYDKNLEIVRPKVMGRDVREALKIASQILKEANDKIIYY